MQPLRSVLLAFAERPEVAGVVVVSDDGLVVDSSLPPGHDAEELAALATNTARSVATLSTAAALGRFGQMVVDGAEGAAILQRLPTGGLLFVLATQDGDLGALLHDLRRHTPALVSLL